MLLSLEEGVLNIALIFFIETFWLVPATSESLMVVANLFLVPPIAYIMPGAQLQVRYRGRGGGAT